MLTQEQTDLYQTNGYIAVENVISAKDIAELRKITDKFVINPARALNIPTFLTLSPCIRQKHLSCGVSKSGTSAANLRPDAAARLSSR